jgi:hypothetical protein
VHICVDSAYPSVFQAGHLPGGATAVQGYIGERSPINTPTPHKWARADWAGFAGVRKYPMFVGSPAVGAHGDPWVEADECIEALFDVGARRGCVVGLDMETAVDSAYVLGFWHVLAWAGYPLWVYGSAATVFSNPACDGYDVADWTGVPHLYPRKFVRATQYAGSSQSGGPWDLRVIRWWQWRHRLWV